MKWYVISSVLFIVACTNLSQKPSKPVNQYIESISYSQVIKDKNARKNVTIRLGGLIIDVENKKKNSLVQVLFFPLDNAGEPQLDKKSGGRFVVKSTDFFDPMIYTKNRKITVEGTLNGEIERTVGERIIRVPLVQSSDIHLWPHERIFNQNGHYYSEDHHDDYDHGD